MRLRKLLAQAIREVAEEMNIPEEEIWKVVPKIKGKV